MGASIWGSFRAESSFPDHFYISFISDVYLFVCLQNNSKSTDHIVLKLSQYVVF